MNTATWILVLGLLGQQPPQGHQGSWKPTNPHAMQSANQGQTGNQSQMAQARLEGQWKLVYAEENGRNLNVGMGQNVTMHGNTLTWQQNGKTWHFQFGQNDTVQVSCTKGNQGANAPQAAQHGKHGHAKGQQQTQQQNQTQASTTEEGTYALTNEFLCVSVGTNQQGMTQGSARVHGGNQIASNRKTQQPATQATNTPNGNGGSGGQLGTIGTGQQGQNIAANQPPRGNVALNLVFKRETEGR